MFYPKGELLASLDSTGTVLYWQLQNGTVSYTLKAVAVNMLRWSPDGQTIAIPGLRNDVVMYDEFTGEKIFVLRGDHVELICYLTWAPNGKYIATSGLDKQVLLWDLDKKQDIHRLKFHETISCMAWKPNSNALSVIDVRGRYGIWESVVPSSMLSPTLGIPDILPNRRNDNEIKEQLSSASQSLDSDHQPSRKRLREKPVIDDDDEEFFGANSLPSGSGYTEKLAVRSRVSKSIAASTKYKMQTTFQPGATPLEPGKKTFLCYNMLGCITRVEHEGRYRIETDFHDTGRGPRGMSMTDNYDFTMASINENGCVFANSCKGEKNMSVLSYRPSRSWASKSEVRALSLTQHSSEFTD